MKFTNGGRTPARDTKADRYVSPSDPREIRRDLMRQRDIALAQRDLATFHRLTRELADLPFPGIAPLTDADKARYGRKRTR